MKNKLSFLMGVAGLFMFTASHAQLSSSLLSGSEVSTEIEGTPYLDANFVPGVVYSDNKAHKVSLRYNMYKDVMEYTEGKSNMSLEPAQNIRVSIGNSTFVARKFEYKRKPKLGYLTVLDSGKVTLYAKKVVTYHNAKKGSAPDFKDILAGYDQEPDVFYYQLGDGELHELESVKSMIASLPEKQDELAKFAKKEKISASKADRMVKFVQYYNSL